MTKAAIADLVPGVKRQAPLVLLKDLVIPAGTVFRGSPTSRRYGAGNIECTIGLSRNSFGTLTYALEDADAPQLSEWFGPQEGARVSA